MVCNHGDCVNRDLHSHSGNLERHLKHVHPHLYAQYVDQKYDEKKPTTALALKALKTKTKFIPDKKPTAATLKTKINADELNRANIELAIVDFFTKNGRPLNMVEDRAFKILVQPAFYALGISVDEHRVNERIHAFCQKWKREIIKELKGKLLSLKIDAVTRQGLSVLGINVQYMENKGLEIKTLAVKQLKSSHSRQYLKNSVLEVLKEYEIDVNQIFTITTDNGANTPKPLNDLNADLQISLEEEEVEDEDEATEESNDSTMEAIEVNGDSIENQMYSILEDFSSNSITAVCLGAHILHLCVRKVIERPDITMKLDQCRSKIPNLKIGHENKPSSDTAASWNSTFDMLQGLEEIQDRIDPLSSESLSSEDWNFATEFMETFKPIHTATIKLQSEQICVSELYAIIMDIIFQIESLPHSEMKTLLVSALNEQKHKLFSMDLFNAAIFLDPRIKICLNAEQEERAKRYIRDLYQRMNTLKGNYPYR